MAARLATIQAEAASRLRSIQYLQTKYGGSIGKAAVTGYCIKFKALKDINLDSVKAAIQDGIEQFRA